MNEKKRKEKKKDIVFPYNEDIGCEVQAYLDELEGTQRARVCVWGGGAKSITWCNINTTNTDML